MVLADKSSSFPQSSHTFHRWAESDSILFLLVLQAQLEPLPQRFSFNSHTAQVLRTLVTSDKPIKDRLGSEMVLFLLKEHIEIYVLSQFQHLAHVLNKK